MFHWDSPAAWPSERNARIAGKTLDNRLAAYRDELGLDRALDFHGDLPASAPVTDHRPVADTTDEQAHD